LFEVSTEDFESKPDEMRRAWGLCDQPKYYDCVGAWIINNFKDRTGNKVASQNVMQSGVVNQSSCSFTVRQKSPSTKVPLSGAPGMITSSGRCDGRDFFRALELRRRACWKSGDGWAGVKFVILEQQLTR
jgi:hypothetical protein